MNERIKQLAKQATTIESGDDGQWAYNEIVSLRKQRDELLAALTKLSVMKLNMIADGIVDKAIASVKGEQ